jgi:hypothetical protein
VSNRVNVRRAGQRVRYESRYGRRVGGDELRIRRVYSSQFREWLYFFSRRPLPRETCRDAEMPF